jgi:membrane protease YdiL (CAAX protease family)
MAGFAFYWVGWCLLLPLWVLGPGALADLFRNPQPSVGRPTWLGLLLLSIPLLLGYVYAFPRAVRRATVKVLLASAIIALINGVLEELLWRGAYVTIFPDQPALAWIYPAVGFAVWHFAPQSVFPNRAPGGNLSLVLVAGLVGLMWGWVAWQTGSILWASVSHVLFDFSGLGGRIYFQKVPS